MLFGVSSVVLKPVLRLPLNIGGSQKVPRPKDLWEYFLFYRAHLNFLFNIKLPLPSLC